MNSVSRYQQIQKRLEPLRNTLLEHPVYVQIQSLESLRLFMEHHVFAVWDFMSLLKSLQRSLCCVEVPWLPPADRTAVRLINEIVLGEESDEDGAGSYSSHFELYHRAMKACGASTICIDEFLVLLRNGKTVDAALVECQAPLPVRDFVRQTFLWIQTQDPCQIASAFTFGREDLLPDVFQRIVDELNEESCGDLDHFQFYLQRHIELDGDRHGPMALRLISSLCGDDEAKWQRAEQAAVSSLEARIALWDSMHAAMTNSSCRHNRTTDVISTI